MKIFLIKMILFVFLITALLSAPVLLVISRHSLDKLVLPDNIDTIIVGDSHPQCAFNDKLLPNSLNICHAAEGYFYTYYKIERILEHNPGVKNIIIGYSYHSIGGKYDYYIKKNNVQFKTMCGRYLLLYNADMFRYLLKINPVGMISNYADFAKKSAALLVKDMKHKLKFKEFPFIGQYLETYQTNLSDSSIAWTIGKQYHDTEGKYIGISDIQIEYLQKTINLLKEKNINLVLVNTPVYSAYLKEVPQTNIETWNRIMENNKDVLFINDAQETFPYEYWRDGEHLNSKSADLYTVSFYNRLLDMGFFD